MITFHLSYVEQHPALLAFVLFSIVGFPHVCRGEEEDYYMQELLSREHYYRVPALEDSAEEGHNLSGENLSKMPPKSSGNQGTKPAGTKINPVKSVNKKAEKTHNSISEADNHYTVDSEDCPPLGLETLKIDDYQLHASTMQRYGLGAHRARLNIQGHDGLQHLYEAIGFQMQPPKDAAPEMGCTHCSPEHWVF